MACSRGHNYADQKSQSLRTSTYFSKQSLGEAPSLYIMGQINDTFRMKRNETYEGKIVPLDPPSGISLFFKDCVDANA
jgi:hypothetical protein